MNKGSCFGMPRRLAWFVLTLSVVCLLGTAVFAGQAKYRWKFANTLTMPHVDAYFKKFCDKVTEYTGGQVSFRFYPDSQLGTHDETFHGVQEGSIQIAQIAPYVHLVPGGMINWMPWTISSWKEFNAAFEPGKGVLWKLMPTAFAEVGMYPLFYRSYGGYGIGNRVRELKTPDDFKGFKFRVSGSLGFVRTLENMSRGTGATFETIPFSEVYNALSKGVVDAIWAHWPQLLIDRHGEVLNYYTDLCWSWDSNAVVINLELWESLPEDMRSAISRAAAEVQVELAAFEQESETGIIENLKKQITSLKITHLSDAEKDAFQAKSNMPAVWDELCKPWLEKAFPGQNMTQKLQDELAEVRRQARESK